MRELWLSWLVYVPALAITMITYWRLPPGGTYHFNETGVTGAISRTVVELNYPVGLAAIAMLAVVARWLGGWLRPLALVAAVGCLTLAIPGIVSQDDLTARYRNLPAAAGAMIALGVVAVVCLRAPAMSWATSRLGGDPARIGIAAVMLVWAIPWMFALCGFYVSSVPVLGDVFRGAQPTPGEHALASVHRGLHEGLAGTQLAITALLLSRALGLVRAGSLRVVLSLYLALMLCYGVMVAAQDGWNEQLIKRGLVSWDIPNVLTPGLSAGWAIVILAALAVHFGWFRREPARSTPSGDTTTAGRSS
jgi:hypothetical protein